MKLNQRKTGAILTYVQIILSNTISLIYTPFALRMLGQSQYGLFGTASSFTSYLSLLGLGIGGAYIRWNAKYRATNDIEGERRLNGLFFTIFSIISVVTLLVGIGLLFVAPYVFGNSFTESELHDLLILIFLSVLNTALTFFMTPIFSCIQSYEKFLILRIVGLCSIILTPILNIIALLAGGKAVTLQIITFILSVITFIIYYIYAIKVLKMKFIFRGFTSGLLKEILLFSSFIFMNTIATLISDTTDSVILAAVAGASAVSVYTIGHNFQNYFSQLSTAVSSVFAPQINMLVAIEDNNEVLTKLMLKVGRVQFYITSLIIIGFIFFGKPFILLWIWWGGIGAVFATFLCCVFGQAIFMNFYYHKGIGLNMIYFWKNILKIIPSFIPAILVGILFNTIISVNSVWMFLIGVISLIVVYIISIWFMSMIQQEKDIFAKPVKSVISKLKKRRT